jgi:subtilisin family serine protease
MAAFPPIFKWLVVFSSVLVSAVADPWPHVHPGVYRSLREKTTINLVASVRGGTISALEGAGSRAFAEFNTSSRGAQIARLVDRLRNSSAEAQQPLAQLLGQESETSATFSFSTPFWISNQMLIADASVGLVRKLEQEPSIAEIHEEEILTMGNDFKLEQVDRTSGDLEANIQAWGVRKIGAEAVWAQGIVGENVTIATIDSGARSTHEALRDNYVGEYGWFDPETKRAAPFDSSGHGTSILGSIVGAKGIGVAPSSKWMACLGCRSSTSCLESSLLACAQFVLCPTDPAGRSEDCSKAPRVVNNSWGAVHGAASFSAVIAAWRAADIIPIFSAGNSGSPTTCSTVVSPGDAGNVIAVGATNSDDVLLPQSSAGPSPERRIKPDMTAPGVRIYSAWWTRDNVYAITSGTSLAAPHVTGAVALLLSANPKLTYEQAWALLTVSTVRNGKLAITSHSACGNISAATFPNNIVGYGRLDIEKAIAAAKSD